MVLPTQSILESSTTKPVWRVKMAILGWIKPLSANLIIHAGTGLRVVDASRQDVPWDGRTLGEVIVAGNTVAIGYYNNPEATEKAFRDGWFHTGDMAIIHPDGYLEIQDRLKDLIYVETDYGWENISSIEIENVLCRHEQVKEAAVVGISPEELGKNPSLSPTVDACDTLFL
jgi:fatty-acyl-CoA synthase